MLKEQFSKIYKLITGSIKNKFIAAFLFFFILPFILITFIFIGKYQTIMTEKELLYINEKTKQANNQITKIFTEMDNLATSIILNEKVMDILMSSPKMLTYDWFEEYKTLQEILDLPASYSAYQYSITLITPKHIYLNNARHNSNLKIDDALSTYIQTGNGSAVYFNRQILELSPASVLSLGRAIYHKGNLLGIILVEVNNSYIENTLNPFENNNSILYILNQDGSILYSSDTSIGPNIPENLQKAIDEGRNTVVLNGVKYLMQSHTEALNKTSVIFLLNYSSVYRESTALLIRFFASFIPIITAAILAILKLTDYLSKNIKELNSQVITFGKNTSHPITINNITKDEVGQLSKGVMTMSKQIISLLHQIKETEAQKRELEFQNLQTQVNPHMIYNTLNTITYLAEMQNVHNIQEISSSFANLLKIISKNKSEFILISDELDYLQQYINIKKYNLLFDIKTDFQIDPDAMNSMIPKLLLQPLAENAIIHGFSQAKADNSYLLTIRVIKHKDRIAIDVIDNGIGMSEEAIENIYLSDAHPKNSFLSIGIRNVMERLRLQYGDQSIFQINSYQDIGTTIHIEYPDFPYHKLTDV